MHTDEQKKKNKRSDFKMRSAGLQTLLGSASLRLARKSKKSFQGYAVSWPSMECETLAYKANHQPRICDVLKSSPSGSTTWRHELWSVQKEAVITNPVFLWRDEEEAWEVALKYAVPWPKLRSWEVEKFSPHSWLVICWKELLCRICPCHLRQQYVLWHSLPVTFKKDCAPWNRQP